MTGKTNAIKVIVEPPTKSSKGPNDGTVSATKTTKIIIAVRAATLPKPISKQKLFKKISMLKNYGVEHGANLPTLDSMG